MLTKEDILAIADLMDEKLKPINTDLAEMKKTFAKVDQLASENRVLIENEIDRAIKVLGDGHQGILEGMKGLVTQEQLEDVSVRVFALEEGVKEHGRQIEELQRKTG